MNEHFIDFHELLNSKDIKPKQKTEFLSKWILEHQGNLPDLLDFATGAKETVRATCIEAIEFATTVNPAVADYRCFDFAVKSLKEKAPRVKWESAKVIANTAHLYPENLDEAVSNLLDNTTHSGTVVRWSAAYALGNIMKLNLKLNTDLIPAVESVIKNEEKNSIRKIYADALKKLKL